MHKAFPPFFFSKVLFGGFSDGKRPICFNAQSSPLLYVLLVYSSARLILNYNCFVHLFHLLTTTTTTLPLRSPLQSCMYYKLIVARVIFIYD